MANKSLMYIATSIIALAGVTAYLQMTPNGLSIDVENHEMVIKGKRLYAKYCADCHGQNLEGESEDWRDFKDDGTLPAPPHDKTGHTWHHDDKLLFDYVKLGGAAIVPEGFKSAMPSFENVLLDEEIIAVLSYIKSSWPRNVQEKHNQRNQAAQN